FPYTTLFRSAAASQRRVMRNEHATGHVARPCRREVVRSSSDGEDAECQPIARTHPTGKDQLPAQCAERIVQRKQKQRQKQPTRVNTAQGLPGIMQINALQKQTYEAQ